MILKNIKAVFLSNIIIQALGVVASIVIKRLIEPSAMGVWNLVNIVTNYIQMFNLGTATAAQREMPYYLGRGDLEMEKKIRETYFSVIILEVVLASAVFLIYFFARFNFLAVSYWFLYLLAPFYALMTRIYSSMMAAFQVRQQFVHLSKQNVVISIAGILLTILGGWCWGIIGLFIGFALLYAFRIYLSLALAKKIGLIFTIKFHPAIFKNLFKMGIAMEIASYLWGIFATIDSVMAAKWLGVTQLAFYSVGVNFSKQLSDFPTQINTIFYPRIMHKFGKENNIKSVSSDVFAFFVGNLLVVVPFICLAGSFALPWMIRTMIRNYSDAITPTVILIFTIFFVPQMHILLGLFNLKKQLNRLIVFNGAILLITFGSILLFNLKSQSLFSIAMGTLTGYFLSFILLFLFSTNDVLDFGGKVKILSLQMVAFILTIASYLTLEWIFPYCAASWQLDLAYTLIKITISFILCLPLALYGLMLSGAWDKVKEEICKTWAGLQVTVRAFIPESRDLEEEAK